MLENAHKAAKRGDVYFTAGCITRAVSMLVQVLYALNETYFLSEKNLAKQTSTFKIIPKNFLGRIETILSNVGSDAEQLITTVASTNVLLKELQELSQISY